VRRGKDHNQRVKYFTGWHASPSTGPPQSDEAGREYPSGVGLSTVGVM